MFKDHPPPEDCPICFLPLPFDDGQVTFESCCGKDICNGCIIAMYERDILVMVLREGDDSLCAFCRTPGAKSYEEEVARAKKLMEKGNADAYYMLANYYDCGTMGMPQDRTKANELYLKAGELGCAEAYFNLGYSYNYGEGVEIDKKKAKYFYELAAIRGDLSARHNLGVLEKQTGNLHRAMKHFILAARAGHEGSLNAVKEGFMHCVLVAKAGHKESLAVKKGFMAGIVTKDDYASTLRAYQTRQDETKSDARDRAIELRIG